jgi:hypothetical protein
MFEVALAIPCSKEPTNRKLIIPAAYAKLMAIRRRQLEERHERALAREDHRRASMLGFTDTLIGDQSATVSAARNCSS